MRYEEIEHTADVRLKIYGADERELFANAAFALFDRQVDLSAVEIVSADKVVAGGAEIEETLVNFLNELLYRLEGEDRVYREFEITELDNNDVAAICSGETFDPARHEKKLAIKAVTFHDIEITRGDAGLSVAITCDV